MGYEVPRVQALTQATRKDCWLTSAIMIMGDHVKRIAWTPTEPLFRAYGEDPHGIRADEMFNTLSKMGMKPLYSPQAWKDKDLEDRLKTHGALWCAGNWGGHNHVVVAVGVNGNWVIIHDPAPPPRGGRRSIPFKEFSKSVELVACKK